VSAANTATSGGGGGGGAMNGWALLMLGALALSSRGRALGRRPRAPIATGNL